MFYNNIVDQTDRNAGSGYEATVISEAMFGVNTLINNRSELNDHLKNLSEDISFSTLRYPGGSVTEEHFNLHLYDGESFDELVDTSNPGANLLEFVSFLDLAASVGSPVSFVIPTRYGLGATSTDSTPMTAGMALLDGNYGNRVPRTGYIDKVRDFVVDAIAEAGRKGVTIESFEIGNEFWGSGQMTAREYALLTAELTKAIAEELSELNLTADPKIIIQSISSAGEFSPSSDNVVYVNTNSPDLEISTKLQTGGGWEPHTIMNQGSAGAQLRDMIKVFDNDIDAQNAVDGIIEHVYETGGFALVDISTAGHFQNDYVNLFKWESELERDFDFYVTEWNTKRLDAPNNRGLEHASMLVEVFYEMATHGINGAQIWPLFSANSDSTSLFIDGTENRLTFAGVAFDLMSESLVELTPFLDYETSGIDLHGFKEIVGVNAGVDAGKQVYFFSERSGSAQSDVRLDLADLTPDAVNGV